ncbi:MAG TPA: helix-hairpin-helix domain-containing protein [Thermoanaerobaculia bacterium]|jgi:competence protein ComEA
MRKSHPIVVFIASLLLLATTSAFAADVDSAPAGGTGSTPAVSGVVNINTAEAAQLALLPRVGPKAAQRIVEYRKEHGPFRKTSDLMQVKGIGLLTWSVGP